MTARKYPTRKGLAMGFVVNGIDLSQAATQCDNTAGDVATKLTDLKNYIVNDVESWWQGIAAGQFQQLMGEYDLCANAMNDALTKIANGLRGTWGNYEQSEQDAVNIIKNIQSGLPPPNLG